jgi:hypothetical protein
MNCIVLVLSMCLLSFHIHYQRSMLLGHELFLPRYCTFSARFRAIWIWFNPWWPSGADPKWAHPAHGGIINTSICPNTSMPARAPSYYKKSLKFTEILKLITEILNLRDVFEIEFECSAPSLPRSWICPSTSVLSSTARSMQPNGYPRPCQIPNVESGIQLTFTQICYKKTPFSNSSLMCLVQFIW